MADSSAPATWLAGLPPLTLQMREQLRAAYWQGLLHTPIPAVITDLDGAVLAANEHFQEVVGYDETELHGRSLADLAHESDRSAVADVVRRLRDGSTERVDHEARWVRPDSRVVWSRRHVFRVDDETTGRTCLASLIEDVTAERLAQRQAAGLVEVCRLVAEDAPLADAAERLAALAEDRWSGVGCALTLLDDDGRVLVPVAHGRLPAEYVALLPQIPVGPEGAACGAAVWQRARVAIPDLATDPRAQRFRAVVERFGVVSGWSVPVVDPAGDVVGALGLFHGTRQEPDEEEWQALENLAGVAGMAVYVARQRERQQQRAQELRRDATTGLPNLLSFLEAIADDCALPGPLSVGVVRVHDLAGLSSALGGDTADLVLSRLAGRLEALGGTGPVALVGPMTLGVASRDTWGGREAVLLRRALLQPMELAGHALRLDLRVGVATKPTGGQTTADALLHDAFVALPSGPGAAAFDPVAVREHLSLYALAGEVPRALRDRELVLHYQPKYDLRTGAPVGSEALVRWEHPERGLLPPGEFLRAVDLAGATCDLAVYVAKRAVEEVDLRHAHGLPGKVAVNLTADDLRNDQVLDLLCDPDARRWEHLDIELTETTLSDGPCVAAMERLAAVGYAVALDDFGTGYSSLSALHSLPVAVVKIDRSFVQRLPDDPAAEALVGAVTAMCAHLGVEVVAEGIETTEQAAAAARLGCGTGQGYRLRRPMPAAEHRPGSVDLEGTGERTPPPAAVVAEDAAALARRMCEGGASPHTVAAALNRAGHRTPSGGRWHARSVGALLSL